MIPGIVIGAPASASGKTTVTLALLRHLREREVRVGSLKVGPDYIDPAFHAAASGRAGLNLDPWAMREATFAAAIRAASENADLVVEGVSGGGSGVLSWAATSRDSGRRAGRSRARPPRAWLRSTQYRPASASLFTKLPRPGVPPGSAGFEPAGAPLPHTRGRSGANLRLRSPETPPRVGPAETASPDGREPPRTRSRPDLDPSNG